MSTILVTGGAGFIGSNFIRLFQKKYTIINFDKLTYAGDKRNILGTFVRGDIANKNHVYAVFKKYRPDYLVNFAAETHVDRSIHGHAADFVRTNVHGVFTLLEAVKKFGIKKYIQVSTDEVYGDVEVNSKKKFTETSTLHPSSPYSSTKAAGDLLCMSYFRTYGVPVIVTRGSNTYGPHQYPEKLIPFFILRMLQNKRMPLYGDGKNTRDWLFVEDHCRAIELVLHKGNAGEIYNISADEYHTNLDIARRIGGPIEFVPDRPGHDRKYVPDSSKIRSQLGWRSKAKFDVALKETITWFQKNL
ncbi:MAG: dTDP-glucose 4,6-dehydratase [Patescibacteria group bacterium]